MLFNILLKFFHIFLNYIYFLKTSRIPIICKSHTKEQDQGKDGVAYQIKGGKK